MIRCAPGRGRAGLRLLLAGLALAPWFAISPESATAVESVVVGSKAFPESWILGEALTLVAGESGVAAEHRRNLGGTEIVYQALRAGSIDAYPEYTGTIAEVLLKRTDRPGLDELRAGLEPLGLALLEPLGFNDGYGLAVTRATAKEFGLSRISDLSPATALRYALTHEFLGRADGWPGLARAYGLKPTSVQGIQHELAWEALQKGAIEVTDVYTTDAPIVSLDLVVLADDRAFFPRYDAVVVYRADLAGRAPAVLAAWRALSGRIGERAMTRANGRVALEKRPAAEAARALLDEVGAAPAAGATESNVARAGSAPHRLAVFRRIGNNLLRHLQLVSLSLLAAVAVGLPLGVLASRSRMLATVTLAGTGLLQTIPSLALLAILIPFLGIGIAPTLVALFLYGLLPIVRNTWVGLRTIAPALVESAEALGLTSRARLLRVYLPLASPTILAGIRTSAVVSVGTATLAALIGAGGLGEPILSGIQLRDSWLIAEGAVPAALLALVVEWGCSGLERLVVPAGLAGGRNRVASEPPSPLATGR